MAELTEYRLNNLRWFLLGWGSGMVLAGWIIKKKAK